MSEMIGAKKNDASGLAPEFENNPYEALDDLLFDSELEYIVSVEDNYLKQAMAKFLTDNNLRQKTKNFEGYEYMFISLDLGTFNFIERPNYKDKKVYELPYDWDELMAELKDYISENPFEKHEISDKNPDSWSQPRTDTPGTNHSENSGKSFLERAKEAVGMKSKNSNEEQNNKIDALLDDDSDDSMDGKIVKIRTSWEGTGDSPYTYMVEMDYSKLSQSSIDVLENMITLDDGITIYTKTNVYTLCDEIEKLNQVSTDTKFDLEIEVEFES
jgi:hypothetical protein